MVPAQDVMTTTGRDTAPCKTEVLQQEACRDLDYQERAAEYQGGSGDQDVLLGDMSSEATAKKFPK